MGRRPTPQGQGASPLEVWLGTHPQPIAAAIAARAVLRVLPALGAVLERPRLAQSHADHFVAPSLRAMSAAWVCGRWWSRNAATAAAAAVDPALVAAEDARRRAESFRSPASDEDERDSYTSYSVQAARAYVVAAFVCRASGEVAAASALPRRRGWAAAAIGAVNNALAVIDDSDAQSAYFQALADDRRRVDAGEPLAVAPLWPNAAPGWERDAWATLKAQLLGLGQDWRVWTGWYEDRLAGGDRDRLTGGQVNVGLELARISLPAPTWETGARAVNREIRELVKALRFRPPGVDADLAPLPAAHRIVLQPDGLLEAQPITGTPPSPALAAGMVQALREAAADARAALVGNLADPALIRLLDRLAEDLGGEADALLVGRLIIRLRMIEAQAAAHAERGLESFDAVAGALEGVSRGLEDLVVLFPEVADIEAARATIGVIRSGSVTEVRRAIAEIGALAAQSPVVGRSVPRAIAEGQAEVEELERRLARSDLGPAQRARDAASYSAIVGQQLLTAWNVMAAPLRVLADGARATADQMGGGLRKGLVRGAEQVGRELVEDGYHAGLLCLALGFGAPLEALAQFAPFLVLLRKTRRLKASGPPAAPVRGGPRKRTRSRKPGAATGG